MNRLGWLRETGSSAFRVFRMLRAQDAVLALLLFCATFQWTVPGLSPMETSFLELAIPPLILALVLASPARSPLASVLGLLWSEPWLRIITLWGGWITLVWLFSTDWPYNLNECRWWLLSLLAVAAVLLAYRSEWNRLLWIFLGVSAVVALFADALALTNLFPPPFTALPAKEIFFDADSATTRSVATGFFRHPNQFGGWVFWSFLISLGLSLEKRHRLPAVLLAALFGASLVLSYYRTLLLGTFLAVAFLGLVISRLPARLGAALIAAACVAAVAASAAAMILFPDINFFNNLWYRVDLWQRAVQFIRSEPVILLFGSGFSPSAALMTAQARIDPHNAYIYALMRAGVPGLLFFMGALGVIIAQGWRAYRSDTFRGSPVLAALWCGWIIWILTDLLDSRLVTSEWFFQFLFVGGMFLEGLRPPGQIPPPDFPPTPQASAPRP